MLKVAVAATFVWLGMVVAISFIEAPIKFRAPGVTLLVRPRLAKRTARVLAGEVGARSRAHLAYIACELVKVAALLVAGIILLDR